MKKIIVALVLIALVVFTVSGCNKAETKPGVVVQNTELDQDIKNLDDTDSELNTSDLDNLDKDLEQVNW